MEDNEDSVGCFGRRFLVLVVFVWMYYDSHKPKAYMPSEGSTFPLDTHGSVVYLTAGEHYFLYGLMTAGIEFALLAAFSYFMSWRD